MKQVVSTLPLQQIQQVQYSNERNFQIGSKDARSKGSTQVGQDKKEKLLQGFCDHIKIRNVGKPIDILNQQTEQTSEKQKPRFQCQTTIKEALTGSGRTSLQIDQKMVSQIWKICLDQTQKDRKHDFEGQLELKFDYTQIIKKHSFQLDQFSQSNDYFKKIDGSLYTKYSVKYLCKQQGENYLSKRDITNLCYDLMKKIKNANCQENFYQPQMGKPLDKSQLEASRFSNKITFEADTNNITPFDFLRLVFVFSADQKQNNLNIKTYFLMPNISFTLQHIPGIKVASQPLSRLLIGKLKKEDEKIQTNFQPQSNYQYSGFLSIDSWNRLFPLLPNDPLAYQVPTVGIWFYGVQDLRSPYVWATCARFIFCRNFEKGERKVPCAGKESKTFIVAFFSANKSVECLSLKLNEEYENMNLQWVIGENEQSVPRDQNLQFQPFQIPDISQIKTMMLKDYLEKLNQKPQRERSKNQYVHQQSDVQPTQHQHNSRIQVQFKMRNQASSANRETSSRLTYNFKNKKSEQIKQQCDFSGAEEEPEPNTLNVKPLQQIKPQNHTQRGATNNDQLKQNISVSSHNSRVNRSRNSQSKNRNRDEESDQGHGSQSKRSLNKESISNHYCMPLNKNMDQYGHSENLENGRDVQINASPRSKQLFFAQQKQIQSLQQQVQEMQLQMQQMKQLLQQSQVTTAYQSTASQSRYNSQIQQPNSQQQPSANEYKSNAYQSNFSENHHPPLISQPTAEFAQNKFQQPLSYQERYELGQIETLGRLDQRNSSNKKQNDSLQQDFLTPSSSSEDSDEEIKDPDLQIIDKDVGAKRSRNNKKKAQQPNRQNSGNNILNQEFMKNFHNMVQSQTISDASACFTNGPNGSSCLSNSNSKLKRSQSSSNYKSSIVNSSVQELNAFKSDLNKQYEENIAMSRPKASRNVLNNVNKQVKEEKVGKESEEKKRKGGKKVIEHSSSSESSSDEDGVDHTYNPYRFGKIEAALFKKDSGRIKQEQIQEVEPHLEINREESFNIKEDESEKAPIIVQQLPPQRGKSDWTMDLPKINYKKDEDEDEDSSNEEELDITQNENEIINKEKISHKPSACDKSEFGISHIKVNYEEDEEDSD